jgi:DNA-binding PadR family transcriptional regulator
VTTPLPATAWAVLGLLSFGRDLSGYDLKKWADSSLRYFYWTPAASQIYAELRRLEALGYVTSVGDTSDARNKRIFRITDSGRSALAHWVDRLETEPPVLKHHVMVRVWLGHLADPERLRVTVAEHRDRSVELAAQAAASAAGASADPTWELAGLVNRWSQRHHESEARLAEELLGELDALAARRAVR